MPHENILKDKKIGFCLTGSFCVLKQSLEQMKNLVNEGAIVTPILSFSVDELDTRFYKAQALKEEIKLITEQPILKTIVEAEPIGPQKLFDLVIVAPCTGNTLAKLAMGITDTPVTMAVKAHLRNSSPVLIGVSTNDGLANGAKNIGQMMNNRHIYFIPFGQDDPNNKEKSLVCKFPLLPMAAEKALSNVQLQPLIQQ